MKEKISCSLDGEIVNRIDGIVNSYPFIQCRSAVIEMAVINLLDDIWLGRPQSIERFISGLYGRRCDLNARKENENRNL